MSTTKLLPSITVGLMVILAAVTGMVYSGWIAGVYDSDGSKESRRISVSGQGEVKTAPDRTRILLNIQTRGNTAEESSSLNARVFEKLSKALADAGVAKDKVETLSYNISPVYEYPEKGRPILLGYDTRHRLQITVVPKSPQDLGKESGKIIDVAVSQGVNLIEQVEFTVGSETRLKLKDEALKTALSAAKSKADLMAQALGVKLLGVKTVSEAGFVEPPPPVFRGSVAEVKAATDVAPGMVTISASVTVVYGIE